MSKVNGRQITCDVCELTMFVKRTGETRWDSFEEADGWATDKYGFGDVCPSCAERLERAVKVEVRSIRRPVMPR